jgi:hypothetical protein
MHVTTKHPVLIFFIIIFLSCYPVKKRCERIQGVQRHAKIAENIIKVAENAIYQELTKCYNELVLGMLASRADSVIQYQQRMTHNQ